MIPNISNHRASGYGFAVRRLAKSMLILPVIACVLTCVSCTEETSSPLVDVTPLGDGIRVLAYAILGVGVLGVLGKLVK